MITSKVKFAEDVTFSKNHIFLIFKKEGRRKKEDMGGNVGWCDIYSSTGIDYKNLLKILENQRKLLVIRPTSSSMRQITSSDENPVLMLTDEAFVRRFLILENTECAYHTSEKELTIQTANKLCEIIEKGNGLVVLRELVKVALDNRTPKQNSLIFTLALCARYQLRSLKKIVVSSKAKSNEEIAAAERSAESQRQFFLPINIEYQKALQQLAFHAVPKICHSSLHLFMFVKYCKLIAAEIGVKIRNRGWGRNLQTAISNWYFSQDPERLAIQVTKYRNFEGYCQRDLFDLSNIHPWSTLSSDHTYSKYDIEYDAVFKYIIGDDMNLSKCKEKSDESKSKQHKLDDEKGKSERCEGIEIEKEIKGIAKLTLEKNIEEEIIEKKKRKEASTVEISIEETSKPIEETSKSTKSISEASRSVTETSKSIAETSKPIVEASKSTIATWKPIAEISKPVTKTSKRTKPIARTSKSVTETSKPMKSISEASESVVEISKSTIETSKPIAGAPKPIVEASKSTTETSKPIAGAPKPIVETSKSTAETSKSTKSISETSKSVAETSKSIAEASKSTKSIPETSKSVAETSKSITEASKSTKSIPETSKSVAETSKSIAEASKSTKSIPETSKSVAETSKSIAEASKSTKSIPETSKSVAETSKSIAEASKSTKSTPETSKLIAETSKPIAGTSKSVAGTSKSVAGTSKSAARRSKSIVETWKPIAEISRISQFLDDFKRLQELTLNDVDKAVRLINKNRFEYEHIPEDLLNSKSIWEAILSRMPLTIMMNNLHKMTFVDLLGSKEHHRAYNEIVVKKLMDKKALKEENIHPIRVLLTYAAYFDEHGYKRMEEIDWDPSKDIVTALEKTFCISSHYITPTGLRYCLAFNVTDRIDFSISNNMLPCSQIAAAFAMTFIWTEPHVTTVTFADCMVPFVLDYEMKLYDIHQLMGLFTVNITDCTLPLIWARQNKLPVDAFIICTNNVISNNPHDTFVELQNYRTTMNLPSTKLIVINIVGTDFNIANPTDPNMLDICGFNASVPAVIREFVSGALS
ncbi:RNA-binding protein [Dirofilaria immitis]